MVQGMQRPEDNPFFYYSGPKSIAYNAEHFGEIESKMTGPDEGIPDMDKMCIDVERTRDWATAVLLLGRTLARSRAGRNSERPHRRDGGR